MVSCAYLDSATCVNLLPTSVIFQPCFAAKEVVGGAEVVFLEQLHVVTDAVFRPISGQACGFGFVKKK